ncbi:MAG: hypothetical protein ABIP45_14805, partial [Knoellia sp.]
GERFVAIDRPLDRGLRRALDRDASAVHVFNSEPKFQTLDALLPWANEVRRLIVTDSSVHDFSALSAFTALQELDLFPGHGAQGSLDIASLPELKSLACRGDLAIQWGRTRLHRLTIENLRTSNAPDLETLSQLRELKLSRPGSIPSRLPHSLGSLDLAHLRWPHELSRLSGIDNLQELSVCRVSGLVTLEPFGAARSLRKLVIEECQDLQTLQGVGLAPGAEPLLVGRKMQQLA